MVYARAPPGTPHPGAPIILLAITYFGPKEEAERVVDTAIPVGVASQAINVITNSINFVQINDPYAAMSRHGGYKEFEGGFIESCDQAGFVRAFELFLKYTDTNMATRAGSSCLMSCWNPDQVSAKAASNPDSLATVIHKRGFFAQATPWYASPEEGAEAGRFARDVYEALALKDEREGRRKWGFANNVRIGADMREVYSEVEIKKITEVKRTWDRDSLGWNAAVDGW